MTVYTIRLYADGRLTIYHREGERRLPSRLPSVIESNGTEFARHLEKAVLYMLMHYFDDELSGEIKARLLTPDVARKLQRLGCRTQTLRFDGSREFTVTGDELDNIIASVFLERKQDDGHVRVLEFTGQRRDVVREAARLEATSRLLN